MTSCSALGTYGSTEQNQIEERSSLGTSSPALTSDERKQIEKHARSGPVNEFLSRFTESGAPPSRFFEAPPYELKMGKKHEALLGLQHHMRLDLGKFYARMSKGIEGMQEEVLEFAQNFPGEEGEEAVQLFEYVCYAKPCKKRFPNGTLNSPVPLSTFASHENTHKAHLVESELAALRLYTTSVYKHMNGPLRDENRSQQNLPCPLPVITFHAFAGVKKLRMLHLNCEGKQDKQHILWRGMRTMKASDAFMEEGGTELAFMSTTTDLEVALRYSLSAHSLIFKIVVPNSLSMGANLGWVSAFPNEFEILYPPLTHLQPTGKRDSITVVREGKQIFLEVIEIRAPTLA